MGNPLDMGNPYGIFLMFWGFLDCKSSISMEPLMEK